MKSDLKINELSELNLLTEKIIGCAFKVGNALGPGYLEKVYENALAHELQKVGLRVSQQLPVQVWYDGLVVGDYYVDLLVEDAVLVELKAVNAFDQSHIAQSLHYLKATGYKLCLLINFGKPKVEIKRVIL